MGNENKIDGRPKDNKKALYNDEEGLKPYKSEEYYKDAIKFFDKALKNDSNNVLMLINKGLALYELGPYIPEKYEEAINIFNKVIEIDPKNIDALEHRGSVLYVLGRPWETDKCYEKIKEIEKEKEIEKNKQK